MGIKKDDLSNGIYSNLAVEELGLPLNSFYYRDKNKTSLGFKIDLSKSLAIFFAKTFGLKNPGVFEKKLKQSISGDGKEFNKNNALHSSSLCALLMFYNVSEKAPFSIDIDGEEHKYTEVFFEVKNKVITKPSNMDVVLVNKKTNEILFIECKFSEYLSRSDNYQLPRGYLPYKEKYFDKIGFSEMKVFPEGIKQLVAHYIGLQNFRDNKYSKKQLDSFYPDKNDSRRQLYKAGGYKHIAFMEVLFEIPGSYFNEYEKEAKKVFKLLKEKEAKVEGKPRIIILSTMKYKDLFSGKNKKILSDKVIAYYKI